jgi:hypothetical protein
MGSVIRKSSKESSIYKFAGAGDIRRVLRLQTEDATEDRDVDEKIGRQLPNSFDPWILISKARLAIGTSRGGARC